MKKRMRRNTAKQHHWNGRVKSEPFMFESQFKCSKCPPPAFAHLLSRSVNLLDRFLRTAVLDHLQRFFEFGDWLGFWTELVVGLQHRTAGYTAFRSGDLAATDHSDEFLAVELKPFLCDACCRPICADAPSRWKMNQPGSSWLQSSRSLGRKDWHKHAV